MSHNTLATPGRLAAGPAFTRALRVLGACLALLMLTQLPAYADHIHHLWYNNSNWHDQDLTAKTNGGIATSGGGVAAFSTPGGQFHVYYVDSTYSHLHQLYYNGSSWSDQDLTGLTGGPTAYPYNVTGFAVGNYQYVYYIGTDNHVHETYYVDNWADIDLTAGLEANLASPISLVAFSAPKGVIWVFYQDMNTLGDYVFNFNGTVWSYQQITNSGVYGAYCEAVWATGFEEGSRGPYLFCPGYVDSSQLNLLQFSLAGGATWEVADITETLNELKLGTGIAGYKIGSGEIAVVAETDDTHIHQYWAVRYRGEWDWDDMDMTAGYGAPADPYSGQIVAFVTPGDQQHIYYAPSTEVYQLYYNGSTWQVEDLTNGAGNADANSGMAGFPIGNKQHVFYMSLN